MFPDFCIKIGEFGGALLRGDDFKHNQCYEGRYQPPLRVRCSFNNLNIMKQELFSLGIAIYEVITWRRPSDKFGEESCQVDVKYVREDFPPLDFGHPVRDVIKGCCMESFGTFEQVVYRLEISFGFPQ